MATTQITIDITTPTGVTIAQFASVLSDHWGYKTTFLDTSLDPPREVTNPETRNVFLKRKVAEFIKNQYVEARKSNARKISEKTEEESASQINVT